VQPMDPRKGNHFKLCFLGDRKALGDVDIVRKFVTDLVPAIRMKLLSEPHAYSVPIELEKASLDCEEDEGGVTCVGVLSTSHVSIHTWPERSYAVLDVYSCREFRVETVITHVMFVFSALRERVFVNDLSASLRYPWELPK
jgi:S-adenosylmethionine/arginine decarboxylase-like enzyme